MTVETALVYLEQAYENGYGDMYLIDENGNDVDISSMYLRGKDKSFAANMKTLCNCEE